MHRGKRRNGRFLGALCAGLCLLAAVRSGCAPALLGTAAVAAAAFTVPDAAADALRLRFRDRIEAPPAPEASPKASEEAASPAPPPAPHVQAAEPSSSSEAPPQPVPEIPEEYRGTVREEDLSGYAGGPFEQHGSFWLRNYTDRTSDELDEILKTPCPIADDGSGEPLVLIYHTHATEGFTPYDAGVYDTRSSFRSADPAENMVAVGDVMAAALEARGVCVLHDTALHDAPSYDGSYASSFASASDYLARYPSIRVVLDLHRDALQRADDLIAKPTAVIGGEKCAQLMIVSNCDDGSGLLPNWRENLRFAAAFAEALEARAPGLARPILFSHRKYNQQLSGGALLLEFGSNANTLAEAKRTARIAGDALADFLLRKENGS